jgi:hypothetical protein
VLALFPISLFLIILSPSYYPISLRPNHIKNPFKARVRVWLMFVCLMALMITNIQIYKYKYTYSQGVLQYFTQTWRNNSFWCLLRRLPRPQDVGHLCLRYCKFFNPFYNLSCSAWEHVPWHRVSENRHFSTVNVGLTETGNRTRATCMAGSVARCSANHYAFKYTFI